MKLALGTLGTEFVPRRCIIDMDSGKYWDGDDWTEDPKEAELFTEFNDAFNELHLLMITKLPGQLFTFSVPLVVEVKSRDEISIEKVKEWMKENLHFCMSDNPENSMAMIHLDVSEIKDVSYKPNIEGLRALFYPYPVEEVDE